MGLDPISGIVDAGANLINSIGSNVTAARNLEFQQQNLDYQKAMQRMAWSREDNAVQRRVADMRAAGINPVLAAGGAAQSSAPITVTTPQADFKPVGVNALGMRATMAQIAQTEEQAKLTAVETEKKKFALDYFKEAKIPEEAMDIWGKRIAELLKALTGNAGGSISPEKAIKAINPVKNPTSGPQGSERKEYYGPSGLR